MEYSKDIDEFIKTLKSESTKSGYRIQVSKCLRYLVDRTPQITDYDEIDESALHDYIRSERNRDVKPMREKTYLHAKAALISFFKYLIQVRLYHKPNPAENVHEGYSEPRKERGFLTEEKIEKVLSVLTFDELRKCKRGLFILINLFTGLSKKEIAYLHWDNLDSKKKMIVIGEKRIPVNSLIVKYFDCLRLLTKSDRGDSGTFIFSASSRLKKIAPMTEKGLSDFHRQISKIVKFSINTEILTETFKRKFAKTSEAKRVGYWGMKTLLQLEPATLERYIEKPPNLEEEVVKAYESVFEY